MFYFPVCSFWFGSFDIFCVVLRGQPWPGLVSLLTGSAGEKGAILPG